MLRVVMRSPWSIRIEDTAPLTVVTVTRGTAVLTYDNTTVVVFSRSISLFDRAMYYASGLDPRTFDIILVKTVLPAKYHVTDLKTWKQVKQILVKLPKPAPRNIITHN